MRNASLSLEEVKYFVRLGCGASEQEQLQEVQISVNVDFTEIPQACFTDALKDGLDYAEINSRLEKVCSSQNFHMIEHLGQLCWEALAPLLEPEDVMTLKIHKINPPIGRSLKGSVFQLRGQK